MSNEYWPGNRKGENDMADWANLSNSEERSDDERKYNNEKSDWGMSDEVRGVLKRSLKNIAEYRGKQSDGSVLSDEYYKKVDELLEDMSKKVGDNKNE